MNLENKSKSAQLKFSKPQQVWRWELAVYLFLAGMGAGAFILGIITSWNVFGFTLPHGIYTVRGVSFDISALALLWGPVAAAFGAPWLILDLGKKIRFYAACLNPRTSWLARGFFILSIFIVSGFIILGGYVFAFDWVRHPPLAWRFLEITCALFALGTALYTGILLKSVRFVPIWDTALLPILFLVSALSTGVMGMVFSVLVYALVFSFGSAFSRLITLFIGIELVLILIELFVLVRYRFLTSRRKDPGEASVRHIVFKEYWFLGVCWFTLCTYLMFPQYTVILAVAGLPLLAGGYFLRLEILLSGVKEQIPMHKVIHCKLGMSVK